MGAIQTGNSRHAVMMEKRSALPRPSQKKKKTGPSRRATPPRATREERGERIENVPVSPNTKRDYPVGDVLSHCAGVSREQQPHETQPTHPLKAGEIADGFAGVRDGATSAQKINGAADWQRVRSLCVF